MGATAAQAGAPCRSPRCDSRRPATRQSGWPSGQLPTSSSAFRYARRSRPSKIPLLAGAALQTGCGRLRQRLTDRAMSSQPPSGEIQSAVLSQPGVPVIRNVYWGGLKTLYIKEVRRFFKVQLQTVWAPAVTTLLFLVIFTVALSRGGRMVMGVPFADFIAPGLIVMGMLQSAFANSSFSLLVGKMQGNIVDYLMPPLSTAELIAALIGAAETHSVLVGSAIWVAMQ